MEILRRLYLARPASAGCPDCKAERAQKRRDKRLVDPDLDRNVVLIAEELGEPFTRAYRMRCQGMLLEDIAEREGVTDGRINAKLQRVRLLLRRAGGGDWRNQA